MRIKKYLFVPLCFIICFVDVLRAEDSQTSTSTRTLSPSLAKYFKGEVKKNLEQLIAVDLDYLKRQDVYADVNRTLDETYKIFIHVKTVFQKEKKAAIESQNYITNLKTEYEKWEKLELFLKNQTDVEESVTGIPIEKGPELLKYVQQSKSQVEAHLRRIEAERNAHTPRNTQGGKGGETFEQIHNKIEEETLSKFNTTIEHIIAEEEEILDELKTLAMVKQVKMDKTVQAWIDEKSDVFDETKLNWGVIVEGAKKPFSRQEDVEKYTQYLNPKKLQEYLKEKFNESIRVLVEQYEEKINGKTLRQDNKIVPKIRQEIVQEGIQFKKEHNYLHDTGYVIENSKLSRNPLQPVNVIFDVIDTIIKRDPKDLNKRFAKKLMSTAILLRGEIAKSPACKFTSDKTDEHLKHTVGILAHRFKSEVLMEMLQTASSTRDKVSLAVKNKTEEHHRGFQILMDFFGKLDQCVQTWHKIEDTVTNIEQWEKRFK